MGTRRDGEVGVSELNFFHMVFAVVLQFVSWCSATDCTKLLFTKKVGLAAKTPSCLLASRYGCYSNGIVKQK